MVFAVGFVAGLVTGFFITILLVRWVIGADDELADASNPH